MCLNRGTLTLSWGEGPDPLSKGHIPPLPSSPLPQTKTLFPDRTFHQFMQWRCDTNGIMCVTMHGNILLHHPLVTLLSVPFHTPSFPAESLRLCASRLLSTRTYHNTCWVSTRGPDTPPSPSHTSCMPRPMSAFKLTYNWQSEQQCSHHHHVWLFCASREVSLFIYLCIYLVLIYLWDTYIY